MAQITVDIQHWVLDTPAAMSTCLEDMSANDFRGAVRVEPEPMIEDPPEGWTQAPVWDLELNDNKYLDRPPVQAAINQVVVYFGGVLQTMTTTEFTEQFGVAP
jgi:hypothetical protein